MKKIITCIILIFVILDINLTSKINLKENKNFVNDLLNTSNYYFCKEKSSNKIINLVNRILDIKLNIPSTIIEKKFYQTANYNVEFGYIQNSVISKPRVYIYSTHYTEAYSDLKTVVDASYLLQEYLNSYGIDTIVNERSIKDYADINNLEYKDYYKATRKFLSDMLKENNFDLIIDLHRDAVSYDTSHIKIDDTDYAKIMFVMNENLENINLANKLDDIINNKINITRGVYHKKIDTFNQDLSKKAILVEVGGNYNNFKEVTNSIKVLSEAIKELLDEEKQRENI